MKLADRIAAHLAILRVNHWFKNVLMLPGMVVAASLLPSASVVEVAPRLLFGFVALCVTASSYYTLNELLDAPFDLHHPEKRDRPVPSGKVVIPLAWAQWLVLGALALAIGAIGVSLEFAAVQLALWVMGCIYNIPPLRTKDIAYLDVLTESVNNPLRMLAGWYVVTSTLWPPASLLMAYWMIGGFFMTLKRYAELRSIDDPAAASRYRKSFAVYNDSALLTASVFYACAAMICLGAFMVRYRLELLLAFPFIAIVVSRYFQIALQPRSIVQAPEQLYREHGLMALLALSVVALTALMFVDVPWLHDLLAPQIQPAR